MSLLEVAKDSVATIVLEEIGKQNITVFSVTNFCALNMLILFANNVSAMVKTKQCFEFLLVIFALSGKFISIILSHKWKIILNVNKRGFLHLISLYSHTLQYQTRPERVKSKCKKIIMGL